MMGWAMAVLVEMVTLPFESVEVTGTGTATGVVGKLAIGAGEGVMTMLLDAGAGEFETTGSMALAGCWTIGAAGAPGGGNEVDAGAISGAGESATGAGMFFPGGGTTGVVPVGEATRGVVPVEEGVPGGGAIDIRVSAGAVFSGCTNGGCVLDAGACVGVGPSSGSVDVDVLVRYNAV